MRKGIIFGIALAGWAGSLWAAPAVYVLKGADSRLELEGKSPLHGFTSSTTEINGTLTADLDAGKMISPTTIKIPIRSFRSGNQARDHALQYTTGAERYPDIIFNLAKIFPQEFVGDQEKKYQLSGEIQVNGKKLPVILDVRAVRLKNGVRVTGQTQLTMSQFGLKVPALARFMRLDDRVQVRWSLLLREEKNA